MKLCKVCNVVVDTTQPYRINPTGTKNIRVDDPQTKGKLINKEEVIYDHTDPKAELIHLNCKLPSDL